MNYIRKSNKYKYVSLHEYRGTYYWRMSVPFSINGRNNCSKTLKGDTEENERTAALLVDKYLISQEKQPVNILKKL